jgi:enediyne biosynthesis protein E4
MRHLYHVAFVTITLSFAELLSSCSPRNVNAFTIPRNLEKDANMAGRSKKQKTAILNKKVFHGFSFRDEIAKSGIGFVNRVVDDAARNYKAVHYDHGNGIAVADINNDGRHDIYFVNQVGSNQLWLNQGKGRFKNITASSNTAVSDAISVSASFADTDNDGDADLFVTTIREGNRLFINDGKGVFQERAKQAGLDYRGHSSGAVFWDYDRDGKLDLFLSNVGQYTKIKRVRVTDDRTTAKLEKGEFYFYEGFSDAFHGHLKPERQERSILYRNMGNNTFKDVSLETGLVDYSWSGDATPIDVNEDGWLDLYVLNMQGDDQYYESLGGKIFINKSAEVFPRTPWGSMGVKVFDHNNDGLQDLYLTDMHSDMSHNVAEEMEHTKSKMQWPEKFLRSRGNNLYGNAFYEKLPNRLYREKSDPLGVENYWPWGISVADVNADGYDDIFVTASMNYPFPYSVNKMLLNLKGNGFVDSEFILGMEPRRGNRLTKPWFDLDCSGVDQGHKECKKNQLKGKVTIAGALGSRSSVVFDLDGDGDLDVVTNEFNDKPMVLISDLSKRRPIQFIKVALRGKASNRFGLGSVVKVHTPTKVYTKVHDGKSGYLSQSLLPLYFGLEKENTVTKIEIQWPSGKQSQLSQNLKANTLIVVEEM